MMQGKNTKGGLYFKAAAVLSFLLPFVIYALTTCLQVYTEDCGEFVTGAHTLGVLHPPGYPLFSMLGKIFTFIPAGSIAWRVNIMSGFFGALGGLFLFLLIRRLVKNIPIAFASAMLFCFTPVFWSQCVVAEVYSLNIFFLSVCLYILQIWRENRKDAYLYLFSIVYGLSLTNHHFMTLAGPFFVLFILWNDIRILNRPGFIFSCIGLFVLGLVPYIYLPLAAKANPALNWGNPENLERLIAHIARKNYADVGVNKLATFGINAKWKYTLNFLSETVKQFGIPVILIGIIGLWNMLRKDVKFLVMTAGIFIFNSVLLIFIQEYPYNYLRAEVMTVYYFPCYIVFACWIGYGLSYIAELLKSILDKHAAARVAGIAVLAALMCVPLVANYRENDLSKNYYTYDFGKSMLDLMDKNAIFFAKSDNVVFTALYLQQVEGYRKDIAMYEDTGILGGEYMGPVSELMKLNRAQQEELKQIVFNKIIDENYGKRPMYFSWGFDLGASSKYRLAPFGFIFAVVKKGEKFKSPYDPAARMKIRDIDNKNIYKDFDTQQVLSLYWANLAYYYMSIGDFKNADYCHEQTYLYNHPAALNNAGAYFLNRGDADKAIKFCERALALDPQYYLANFNAAAAYEKKGDKARAIKNYETFCKGYEKDPSYGKFAQYARQKIKELGK